MSAASSTKPNARIRFLDAHNHLQDEWLAPWREKAISQLNALPIAGAVVNGTCEADWPEVAALASRLPWVRPSFGLHPWLVGNRSERWFEDLCGWLDRTPRAVVGEIGLDRWILDRAKPDDVRLRGLRRAPIEEQIKVFEQQLELTAERNLAVTIHCLDAWGALQESLKTHAVPERGFLLHAYGGSAELAKWFAERGAYFSFSGYFLGETKTRAQEVFRGLPLDRLLVETDAPSMPLPQKWRTHKLPPGPDGVTLNHPGNIEAVYAGLAALRGISLSELSEIVAENFVRFFEN
jgi:TatD DNase family protein